MNVQAIKTKVFEKGGDLAAFTVAHVPRELIQEKMILAVTSKIVSLSEGRLVAKAGQDKTALIRAEADEFLGELPHNCFLTVKHGVLIPTAGIDESNSASGDYILYPKDPFASASHLWASLRKAWKLKELGIVMTDSHTSPLRRGVTGVCVSYHGFLGLKNMTGTEDLFGRELRITQVNYADGLAASAVMLMGEGNECQPLAVIQDAGVVFSEKSDRSQWQIQLKDDLYYPLFAKFKE
jgi:F420-0:gamma-glutamyl ligase